MARRVSALDGRLMEAPDWPGSVSMDSLREEEDGGSEDGTIALLRMFLCWAERISHNLGLGHIGGTDLHDKASSSEAASAACFHAQVVISPGGSGLFPTFARSSSHSELVCSSALRL